MSKKKGSQVSGALSIASFPGCMVCVVLLLVTSTGLLRFNLPPLFWFLLTVGGATAIWFLLVALFMRRRK